jgi:hypothetical protein
MDVIEFGSQKINFEIKRGNRKKSVAIRVHPEATVTVFTPRHLGIERIRTIVRKKARWIIEKQGQMERSGHSTPMKEFVSGESFPYLGKYYRLKVVRSIQETEGKCRLVNGRLVVEVNGKSDSENNNAAIKKALIDWYLRHAEDKIGERASRISRLIGRWPASINIKNQEKRWGSCSRTGFIRFNWKIIMAPISVIDYVIVHELCHLIYPHHSFHFWQKVRSVIPDYKKRRDWLKKNSLQMDSLG